MVCVNTTGNPLPHNILGKQICPRLWGNAVAISPRTKNHNNYFYGSVLMNYN